jgi:diguanylate cyclase (GGDEF)-like protein
MKRGAVAIKGGLLLGHFAQLAANVTGTPIAAISVLGRRSVNEPTFATFGVAKDLRRTIAEFDRVLGSTSGLTVVPDLTQDHRFATRSTASGLPDLRFFCHLRLLSSGGEHVGFICVLDQIPRTAVMDAQATSLGHIASMILADRKREQRHFHLMHVANRALRVDRALRLVSEAASCADALAILLEELCRFHGALVGQIWQLIRPGETLLEISRYEEANQIGYGLERPVPAARMNTITVDAIRRNKPFGIKFSELRSSEELEEVTAHGPASQVCIPIWVQQQRFGISLAFSTEHAEFDTIVADIASLADEIRPALLRKVTEERIRFAAHHDALTQLSNRLMFRERLAKALATSRSGEHGFALLCLDLDGFKAVNDTQGHEIGDQLLVAVAQRLRDNMRDGDTVARMGGDEFAIVQQHLSEPFAATALATRLLKAIGRPFELGGRHANIGVSIGIAIYPQDGDSPDSLLRSSDIALYQAKEAGRNTFRLFNRLMQVHHHERLMIEQDLSDVTSYLSSIPAT